MNVGDLVRYKPADDLPVASIELGIITRTDPGMPLRCHVEWFTCDNRGWWSYKNLELANENR
jgi:hypothetical protein